MRRNKFHPDRFVLCVGNVQTEQFALLTVKIQPKTLELKKLGCSFGGFKNTKGRPIMHRRGTTDA